MEGQTRSSLDERISYHESPAYAVARVLRDKGYEIANWSGTRQSEPGHDVVGILKPRDPVQKSFLGIRWNKRQRALFVGTLWLDNRNRGARHGENWVLEVYGRENVPELTELVKELSRPNNVKVRVRLDSEQPKVEFDYYDYHICE